MNIIFMGTPEFSVPCLEMLIKEGHNILFVVTRPDKPVGRGKRLTAPPVKISALAHGIKVLQPVKMRDEQFLNDLRDASPDVIVTVAYGKILPPAVLEIPERGCINVHASLLPKYRGSAPINWVLINGETKTGITIMFMNEGLDKGNIITSCEIPITIGMTAGELHDMLMEASAGLLGQTLRRLENCNVASIPQNDSEASIAPMLTDEIGHIDWSRSSLEVHNLVRGINPHPGAYTTYNGKRMRIWKTSLFEGYADIEGKDDFRCGQISNVSREGIIVRCGIGSISLLQIQFDSARRMDVNECWHRMHIGDYFA